MSGPVRLERLATGISGFDQVAVGGLPRDGPRSSPARPAAARRCSPPSSSLAGIREFDEPGVFVTFEESRRRHPAQRRLAWIDIDRWEARASGPSSTPPSTARGGTDVGSLRLRCACSPASRRGPPHRRHAGSRGLARRGLHPLHRRSGSCATSCSAIAAALGRLGVTSVSPPSGQRSTAGSPATGSRSSSSTTSSCCATS